MTISLANVVLIATALTAVVGAYKLIAKPFKLQINRIDLHDIYLSNDYKKINDLENKFDKNQRDNDEKDVIILKSLQAIMRNQLSGNDNKKQLEKVSEELDEYLLNK